MRQSPRLVIKHTDDAIKKSIMGISSVATRIAPIDTGFLRESIQLGVGFNQMEGFIVPLAEYAVFVHEGTRKWPISKRSRSGERQFLKKGAEREKRNIEQHFEEAIEKVANDIARKAK